MAGTKIGSSKSRDTNIRLYGEDYYRRIGAKGGAAGHTSWLAGRPDRAAAIGKLGGRKPKVRG